MCAREIHALLFGRNGKDFIDCELHQDHWYPDLLTSSIREWYHEKMMLHVTTFGIPYEDERRRFELVRAVHGGMSAVQRMIRSGLLTKRCMGVRFKALGTEPDGSPLVRTSSHANAHFILYREHRRPRSFFTCNATAHHLAELNDAWVMVDANPLYGITIPVTSALHTHHDVALALNNLRESQVVIRRWKRFALVCKDWLRGATDKIGSLIAERKPLVDDIDRLICSLGPVEAYHLNPIQAEGCDDPNYQYYKDLVLQVALGLHD